MLDAHPLQRRFWSAPLDARPIALFRIALGALLLLDLADRVRDFDAFYTAAGVVPERWVEWGGWLFALSSSRGWALAVFALGFLAAAALLVGWRPRVAALVSWLVMRSIMLRCRQVSDGGDLVLIQLLLWSCFVDLGARASLDVRLGRRAPASHVPALPVRVLQLQLALVYVVSGALKLGGDWLRGDAVYLAVGSSFARTPGTYLARWPALCFVVTMSTLAFELAFPLLVFAPVRRLRAATLLFGVAFHLGITTLMRVGVFSYVMIIGYLPFIVAGARMDRLLPPLPESAPPPLPRWRRRLRALVYGVAGGAALWSLTPLLPPLHTFAGFLGVQQPWTMFAPAPPDHADHLTGWGVTVDNQAVDVVAAVVPQLGPQTAWYSRWVKFREMIDSVPDGRALKLGRWLCREYNAGHADRVKRFTLRFHAIPVPPPREPAGAARVSVLVEQRCL